MRILKFFFFALLWVVVIGALIFFLGREIILILGAETLKSDYNSLLKKNSASVCADRYSYNQDYFTQLRFISDKEYNLEVVCADFASSPILLESKKLPPLLFKTSFGSGFVIDERELPFFIKLSVLGRSIYVYTEEKEIHTSYLGEPDLDYNQGPVSSCQAHNYQCCSIDLQSGLGAQITSVNDCPKSCYESCSLRPLVLSFNSRPALDGTSRTVEIFTGETITFSYVLGNGKGDIFSGQLDKTTQVSLLDRLQTVFTNNQSEQVNSELALPLTVKIDFGDGQSWESTNFQDMIDHTYTCHIQTCYFQAQISAQDAQGVLSVNNELTKMIIKVNR